MKPAAEVGPPGSRRAPVSSGARDAFYAVMLGEFALVAALAIYQGDVAIYQHYAHLFVHKGGLPIEYPAASSLLFALPLALPIGYHLAFALEMAVAFAAAIALGRRLVRDPAWATRFVLYVGLGCFGVLFSRFDLVPALAAFLAVVWARDGRFGRAWVAAALGAAVKVFPVLLLPGFFIAEWRASGRPPWRRVVLTAVCGGGLAAIQSAFAPGTVLSPLRWEVHRGFEFSSVPGSLTLLLDPFHVHFKDAFRNWEAVGSAHALIGAAVLVAEIVGVVWVWRAGARRQLDVAAVSVLVLSVAILGGRSLAPQYLIWLAPLWALWPRRTGFVVTAVLTTLTFPVAFYAGWIDLHTLWPAALIAVARNGAFIVATWMFARDRLNQRAGLVVASQRGRAASLWPVGMGLEKGELVQKASSAVKTEIAPRGMSVGGGTSVLDGH